jgi:hypothetical protein
MPRSGPGLWLWFYLTLGYLILAHGFRLISYVLSNFLVVLAALGIPAVLMLVAKIRFEGPFEGVGHWMESMFASISHTISYIRIMAMKMITGTPNNLPAPKKVCQALMRNILSPITRLLLTRPAENIVSLQSRRVRYALPR